MQKRTIFIPALALALAAPVASAQSTGLTHTVEAYFMGARGSPSRSRRRSTSRSAG